MRAIRICFLHVPFVLAALTADLASQPQPDARLETANHATWQELSKLPAATPLVIYLKNGARRQESLVRVTDRELVTHVGSILASDIAAVSRFRTERLWDGTLRGTGIGIGTMSIIAASSQDAGGGAWVGAAIIGGAAGAGFGALFDAAVAMPDKQVYLDAPAMAPRPGIRDWTLRVQPEHLSAWVLQKTVHVMLKDGAYLRGKVKDGNASSIVLALREADGVAKKEDRTVQATDIGTVIVREKLGGSIAAAAVAGSLAGIFGGAAIGALTSNGSDEGPRALLGAGLGTLACLTGAVGGTDRLNWREITLVVQ